MIDPIELAIEQGELAWGLTSPNPPVGCVIVSADNEVVGHGHTQPPTGPGEHAEVMALRMAGDTARGATAVVTLEPCNHTGRTGPCSHALLDAGIARVVYLTPDPNPQAAGGAEFLAAHGVEVRYVARYVAALAPWLASVRQGRPSVTVKMAQTLDGFSAASDRSSQWITAEGARSHATKHRSSFDAIVVGTGTVLADNPKLTAREPDGALCAHQPQPVIIGTREIPADFALARDGILRFRSIDEALDALYQRGMRSVLVEGGPNLVASFFEAGVVDFCHTYVNASFLGAGVKAIDFPEEKTTTMADIRRNEILRIRQFENDILIESRPKTTEE